MHSKGWIFSAIVAIVAVPWGVAWWMSHHPDQIALEPAAHGDLFTTEVEADDFTFQLKATGEDYHLDHHWWMLLVQQGDDHMCENRLHATHQIHVALGKEAGRLRRAVVHVMPEKVMNDKVLLPGDKDLVRLRMTPDQLTLLQEGIDEDTLDFEHGVIVMIDPLGNVVMAFDVTVPPKDVLSDIKRLLRGSHIG